MIFIDASVFVAFGNEKDVHHKRALQLFEEIEQGKYGLHFTSDYVFNETVGVINRKVSREKAIVLGDYIKESTLIINITNEVLDLTWATFKESQDKLSLVDWSIVTVMDLEKIEFLATFDKEFLKIKTIKVIS